MAEWRKERKSGPLFCAHNVCCLAVIYGRTWQNTVQNGPVREIKNREIEYELFRRLQIIRNDGGKQGNPRVEEKMFYS